MRELDVRVSVIVPVGRELEDVRRCVEGVLSQEGEFEVELILIGDKKLDQLSERAIIVEVDELNPAIRRNRGVEASSGEILGFIDDDAYPEPEWMAAALGIFSVHSDVVIVGGPDPAPIESGPAELLTDTLLAAPLFGSGVLAHQPPLRSAREVTSPSALALVNLFVRAKTFRELNGFDESIGYVGEDSDLISRAMASGKVLYSPEVVVRHQRRRFPSGYLRQRFRYRVKTGLMLTRPGSFYRTNPKLVAFLLAAIVYPVIFIASPVAGIALAGLYVVGSLMSGIAVTRLPWYWWPLFPLAFALHHATYLSGLLVGITRGIRKRLAAPSRAEQEQS